MKTFFEYFLDEVVRKQKAGEIATEKAQRWIADIQQRLQEYARHDPTAPKLTPAQVYDALSYYYDHQAEIEEEIRQAHDLKAWMTKYPPTLKVKRDRPPALP